MKKLVLLSAIAFGLLFYNTANAQIGFRFGLRIFPHRIFLPHPEVVVQDPVYTGGAAADNYDSDDDYYYLPDENAYYSVPEQCYYYYDGDSWVSAAYLPGYQDFDWRSARHYEVHAPRPYLHNDFYSSRYHGANQFWAHRDGNFRGGNDNHFNRDDRAAQRFDNRGGYGQPQNSGDNRPYDFGNRDRNGQPQNLGNRNGQPFNQPQSRVMQNGGQHTDMNRDMGNKGGQRMAQNNKGYNGHNNGRRMF